MTIDLVRKFHVQQTFIVQLIVNTATGRTTLYVQKHVAMARKQEQNVKPDQKSRKRNTVVCARIALSVSFHALKTFIVQLTAIGDHGAITRHVVKVVWEELKTGIDHVITHPQRTLEGTAMDHPSSLLLAILLLVQSVHLAIFLI